MGNSSIGCYTILDFFLTIPIRKTIQEKPVGSDPKLFHALLRHLLETTQIEVIESGSHWFVSSSASRENGEPIILGYFEVIDIGDKYWAFRNSFIANPEVGRDLAKFINEEALLLGRRIQVVRSKT